MTTPSHIEAIARAMRDFSYGELSQTQADALATLAFNMSAEIFAETTQAEAVKSNTGTEYHAINRAVVAIRALVKEG